MATTVLNTKLNIVEEAKRRGPDGNVVNIAEVLTEMNELIKYAPMFESNDVFSHLETIRTKLPTVTPRRINSGAGRSASATKQVRETIMLLDVFCEIDEALIDHEPNPKKALVNETKAFLEAAMQEFGRIIIYGDPGADSLEAEGLELRYNDLSLANVRSIGGSGDDLTSIFLLELGEMKYKLIYPRGAKGAGIQEEDDGKIRVTDTSGNPYKAYSYHVKMEFGHSIPDDRAVQRLCNIESSGETNNFVDSTKMRELVFARNHLPLTGRNALILANRDTKSQFDIYAMEKSNGFYQMENITGEPLTTFQGTPIIMMEQILSTESAVA